MRCRMCFKAATTRGSRRGEKSRRSASRGSDDRTSAEVTPERAIAPRDPFTILPSWFIFLCSGSKGSTRTRRRNEMSDLINELEREQLRDETPDFAPGDTVRVLYRVREGEKERIQVFEGVCLGRRGGGVGETFTVRKISGGIGVERIFPLHAPTVKGIEVVRRGRVRRAKLYYLRGLRGKAARIPEKRTRTN